MQLVCVTHPSCRFDFIITAASFAEMIVSLSGTGSEFNGGLTAIRLLRLFRLARYWTGLNIVLRILGSAFKASAYLLALVLLFMFVMGLLGMQVGVCVRMRMSHSILACLFLYSQLLGHKHVNCKHIVGTDLSFIRCIYDSEPEAVWPAAVWLPQ